MFHFYTHFSGDIEMTILAIFSVLWHIKQIRQIHWTKQHRSQNLMIITLFRIFYKFTLVVSISFVTRIFLDKLRTAKQIQKKILHKHVQTVNQPHFYLMQVKFKGN